MSNVYNNNLAVVGCQHQAGPLMSILLGFPMPRSDGAVNLGEIAVRNSPGDAELRMCLTQ
jgi:hypothetical protein